MIEKTTAYRVGELVFPTIQEAQVSELIGILARKNLTVEPLTPKTAAELIVEHTDEVVDILTMTPTSKPSARKLHGGTKKRTPKTETEPQPA